MELGNTNELKKIAFDPAFISSLGVKAKSLEGYIYPETYSFFRKITKR